MTLCSLVPLRKLCRHTLQTPLLPPNTPIKCKLWIVFPESLQREIILGSVLLVSSLLLLFKTTHTYYKYSWQHLTSGVGVCVQVLVKTPLAELM